MENLRNDIGRRVVNVLLIVCYVSYVGVLLFLAQTFTVWEHDSITQSRLVEGFLLISHWTKVFGVVALAGGVLLRKFDLIEPVSLSPKWFVLWNGLFIIVFAILVYTGFQYNRPLIRVQEGHLEVLKEMEWIIPSAEETTQYVKQMVRKQIGIIGFGLLFVVSSLTVVLGEKVRVKN